MKRIHWLIVAAALAVAGAILFAPGGVFAGMKVGVPQFPTGIAVGDNYAEDTLWVMGHIKIDSSGSYSTMALNGTTTIYDSLWIPAVAGTRFGKGGTIYGDSALTFSFSGTKGRMRLVGAVLGVDSMRVLKKFVGENGSTVLLDSVRVDDGISLLKKTPIFGDSLVIFKNCRVDADSMSIALRLQARDNSVALLDSVRVDDGTSFAANMKVWGTNTLVFKGMKPVMDSASLGSKIRVSQDASIYGSNSIALVGAKLTVDTLKVTNRARLSKNTTLYADSLVILSGGRLQADTIAVNRFVSKTGKGPGKSISMTDIKLTADTLFADSIGADKATIKTRLNSAGSFQVNSLPAVVPMSFAFDDDSLADPGPHFAMVMPRGVSVRYVTVDLSEAVGTAPCTLWVKAAADSAALVVANGTDDTTMACDVVCAAGGTITVTSAKTTGSNDGAALGVDAPDCTIWLEWK